MIHTTKGIVLRTVKYGETSVIASIFTELFGIQSYMVNGVRTSSKTSKAHFFQPASILEMQVYHNELKNLQRIKDMKWAPLYKNIFSDVIKNSIALFMVELLQKSLKQPETNPDLYYFSEDAFIKLDDTDEAISANLPIYFALQLAPFLGIGIQDNFSNDRKFFDMSEGSFSNGTNNSEVILNPEVSFQVAQLLKAIHPDDLPQIKLNKSARKEILKNLESYYSWHLPDFGTLKTLPVLHELF